MAGTVARDSTLLTMVGLFQTPTDAGEGRLDPGVAPFAFDGLDERGFLAADIRAAAGLHLNVEAEAGALDVVAQEILGLRGLDGLIEAVHGEVIFAAARRYSRRWRPPHSRRWPCLPGPGGGRLP